MCTGCAQLPAEAPRDYPAPTPMTDPASLEHALVIYYDISGSTASELRESMDKLRLRDPNDGNKAVDSFTAWFLVWYWLGEGTGWCNLSVVFVAYKVIVIMPRWTPPANASPKLIDQWEKYIQSLTIHEKGHVDNLVNNYLGVKTAIQNATCYTAEAEACEAPGPLS